MKAVIAGGTGFLGGALATSLAADGHEVVVLTRRTAPTIAARAVPWTPDGSASGVWTAEISSASVVVNLAGESIAGKRWTTAQKERIRVSRILATRSLVHAIGAASPP